MSVLELEKFLPYRMSVLSNRISQGIAQTYEERYGLTVPEWRVIAILGRHPGISATQVARYAAMDKVAISRAVKRLLEAGRVRRKDDNADRRAKQLWLSDAGERLYQAIVPAALAYEKALLSVLKDEEREQLDRVLDKLQGAAELS